MELHNSEPIVYRKDNLHFQYGLFFKPDVASKIMDRLEKEVSYVDPRECMIKVRGRWYEIPRQQIAFGDPGVTYEYSGKKVKVLDWTPLMGELLQEVNRKCGHTYNFVLVNRYKDGASKIGFHADDEESIDKNVPITSLSFGAARDFIFRHKFDKTKLLKLRLEPGSFLTMEAPVNDFWLHSLPPCRYCNTPRVNLTFRKIKNC